MTSVNINFTQGRALTGNSRDKLIFATTSVLTVANRQKNFVVNFPYPSRSVRVVSYCIPYAWYPVNSRNNTFQFNEPDGADTTSVQVVLTAGVYTLAQFLTELGNRMTTESPNARTYVATSNVNTGKVTITASAGDFQLRFAAVNSGDAAKLLGFMTGMDEQDITSTASVATGTQPNRVLEGTEDYIQIVGHLSALNLDGGELNGFSSDYVNIMSVPVTGRYGDFLTPPRSFGSDTWTIIPSYSSYFPELSIKLIFPPKNYLNGAGIVEELIEMRHWNWNVTFECDIV